MNVVAGASRRKFLLKGGVAIAASTFARAGLFGAEPDKKDGDKEEEVSPAEDLMREHGALKRVLLVYGEAIRRIEANDDLPPDVLMDSAKIIRNFIEDYHEKLEEDFLFPRFKKAGKLIDLVDVLSQQHQGGRKLTDITMHFATNQAVKNKEDRQTVAPANRSSLPAQLQELVLADCGFQFQRGSTCSDPFADDVLRLAIIVTNSQVFLKVTLRVLQVCLCFRREHFANS